MEKKILDSKSFIDGERCEKAQFLGINQPYLRKSSHDPTIMEKEMDMRNYLYRLFSLYAKKGIKNKRKEDILIQTKKQMEQKKEAIFNVALEFENLSCEIDLLVKDEKGYIIYDANYSKKLNSYNVLEIALKYYILDKTVNNDPFNEKYKIRVFGITFNSDYIYDSSGLDLDHSWLSFNKLYATSGVFGCEKGTPGMVGSYFLKLTTRVVGGNPYPAAAVSTKDTAFVNSMPSGFPYNLRPLNFTGQYQYHETGMDSAAIEVFLTKWNTSTKKRDIVGSGQIYPSGGIVSSWTKFNIPILYSLTNNPDSALILIYSSINTQTSKWVANDYLYVDDLAFSTTTGINNMESTKFTLAPNPFDLQTTILFADDQQNTIFGSI